MLTKVIEQSKIDHFTKWFDRADKIVIVSRMWSRRDAIALLWACGTSSARREKTANVIVPNAFPDF